MGHSCLTQLEHLAVLLCTTKLAQSTFRYCFIPQHFHKLLPNTTLYSKACTKQLPSTTSHSRLHTSHSTLIASHSTLHTQHSTLLCTTKVPERTAQYYLVLQCLHKKLPSTTLYYKARTQHFPVPLCITNLAQGTCQYYFGLQCFHEVPCSTTLYYQAVTKYFAVLLSPANLAQVLPSATLYYKASTKYLPVLLCKARLARGAFQYCFALQSFHKAPRSTSYASYTGQVCAKYLPVLQSLQEVLPNFFTRQYFHKLLPSTTLYCRAWIRHFPIPLCNTNPVLLCTSRVLT